MNIVFIAPPAAGKGAQSGMISKEFGIPHVSIGDLLRNVNDEKIRKQLSLGEFVDNSVIEKLLTERLLKDDCKNGYVLDGFPRNSSQIEIYEKIKNISNDKDNVVIVLDIPKEVGEMRICGRLVCPKCGSVYNELVLESRPKIANICDKCGKTLAKRKDDNKETYDKRYDTYLKETAPLIDYFEGKGMVYHIDSSKSVLDTFKDISKVIGGFYDRN